MAKPQLQKVDFEKIAIKVVEFKKSVNSIFMEFYHEKQSLKMCLLHTLNNLFQEPVFTKDELNGICTDLSPDTLIFNPHKSWIGLGNYDVNVLQTALQRKDYTPVWFDKRKEPGYLDMNNIFGYILNFPSEHKLGPVKIPLWKGRHWVAVRELNSAYFNLDSKLDSPEKIGYSADLIEFLTEKLHENDTELFVVVSKTVAEEKTYLHPPYRN